jgi:ABC-type transport system substrate-binding protein
MAREFEESPEVATKQMGSGPYLWGEALPPISTSFRKNPAYFRKPYPYFDEIRFFVSTDDSKKVADFSARNLHLTWWNPIEPADQIRQNRPDALAFEYPASGYAVMMRVDQPPFNDKRVRQALSMAIDRKRVREGVSGGQGEDDQVFSIINKPWGFRRPRELKAARNWNFDPAEAKKLLAAAGIDKPIETTWTHWDASVNGQATVDMAVLIQAKYRELGIANIKDNTVTSAQYMSTVTIGNFDGMAHGPNQQNVVLGTYVRNVYWSPPDGVKAPTVNNGHVNDPRLSQLLVKQIGQFDREERKGTFREIEEIMAEEQYRIILSTYTQTWFADPAVKNIQVPIFAYSGSADYMRYWWLDKA